MQTEILRNPDEPKKLKVPAHLYVLMFILFAGSVLAVIVYGKQAVKAIIANPDTAQNIVDSESFTRLLNQKLEQALSSSNSDLNMDSLMAGSDVLQRLIDDAVSRQLIEYGRSKAFQLAVSQARPEVRPSGSADDADAEQIKQIQRKMRQYESQLAKISLEVSDDDSMQIVNELQGDFVELQQLIGDVSEELRCTLVGLGGAKSSFLLKEKRSTELQVYNVMVSLGSIRGGVIGSVTFTGPNEDSTQVDTLVIGNVKLGGRVEFQSGTNRYSGLFTFRQARLGPDFVGFEVTEMLAPVDGCLSGV
ncbi:MAG: hypothetical protein KUG75_13850 [Pseudomonadales bacterium]|nr:hypothetical protein [Pseudomonadales bacterium]